MLGGEFGGIFLAWVWVFLVCGGVSVAEIIFPASEAITSSGTNAGERREIYGVSVADDLRRNRASTISASGEGEGVGVAFIVGDDGVDYSARIVTRGKSRCGLKTISKLDSRASFTFFAN